MYVIAIDVGIKNLGLCVFDFRTNQFVHWERVSLVHSGRYVPANNVRYIKDLTARYAHYFENATEILVERQMRTNMRIIEAVFQTLYFDKCKVVSPRSVKLHYDLSTNNYRTNKAKAVEWAADFIEANPESFAPDVASAFAGKLDDLADALLLVCYYLDTYSSANTKQNSNALAL